MEIGSILDKRYKKTYKTKGESFTNNMKETSIQKIIKDSINETSQKGLHTEYFKKLIEDDYDRFYYIEPYLDTLQDPEARKLGDSNYKFIMSYR